MAWAAGQSAGAVAGGGLASATGYAVPSLLVAALLVLTAVYAFRSPAAPLIRPATT